MSRLCRTISLPELSDHRGRLMFAEDGRHVPFSVKRIFAIYDVPVGLTRGAHAHRTQHQFIVMMVGSCKILIDEGTGRDEQRLGGPTQGLYVPPSVWLELEDFAPGSICLVLASGLFDEADYIRDYAEFRRLAAAL